jgi:hypothetical protein
MLSSPGSRRGEAFPKLCSDIVTNLACVEPLLAIIIVGMPRPYTAHGRLDDQHATTIPYFAVTQRRDVGADEVPYDREARPSGSQPAIVRRNPMITAAETGYSHAERSTGMQQDG